MNASDALVPNAMRLAEYAHRQRNHRRKAPPGEDRPAYFLHLAEVAWLLMDSGIHDDEAVAAAYLHDILEDCGYDEATLAEAIGNARVAALVAAVSEPDKSQSWEDRQHHYRERLVRLDDPVILALSCADKTSNLRALVRTPPKGWGNDRLADYVVWAAAVVEACGPVDAALERLFWQAHAIAAETYRIEPIAEQASRSA